MEISARHVLLIEDSEPMADLVKASLTSAHGSFDLEWCRDLTSGLKKLRGFPFDIVVLELSLSDSSGIDTLLRVRHERPETPIVVLTRDEDQAKAMRGISEGAQDWVTKATLNPASLPRILHFAIERHNSSHPLPASRQGKILTFIGSKGGVGTTTVALNVAAALASSEYQTVATEWCWPRGHFSLYLAQKPAKDLSAIGTLAPRLITGSRLKRLAVAAYRNLTLLHGPQSAAEFHYLNPAQAEAFVKSLCEISDFTVIDLPNYPSAVSRAAVRHSAVTVVVLERSAESLVLANETLSMVQSWAGPDTLTTAVIVNKGGPVPSIAIEALYSQLHCNAAGMVSPSDELVPGFFGQVPITLSRPHTLAAESLVDIATRLASGHLHPETASKEVFVAK